jgi:hypothetical protein
MSAMAAIAERATAVIRKIDKGEIVASERVRRLIRMVAAVARHDEATERVAVALVLDRHDLLAKDATPYCKQSGVLIGHGSTRRKRLSKWYAGSPNKEGRTTVLRIHENDASATPQRRANSYRYFSSKVCKSRRRGSGPRTGAPGGSALAGWPRWRFDAVPSEL